MPSTKQLKISNCEKSARIRSLGKKYALILGIGLAYLIFVLCTGWGIPCIFHKITGWKCPACGISRMLIALVRLDFAAAFHHNALLLITSPVLLFCLVYPDVKYAVKGERAGRTVSILLWIEVALLLAFGLVRNFIGL